MESKAEDSSISRSSSVPTNILPPEAQISSPIQHDSPPTYSANTRQERRSPSPPPEKLPEDSPSPSSVSSYQSSLSHGSSPREERAPAPPREDPPEKVTVNRQTLAAVVNRTETEDPPVTVAAKMVGLDGVRESRQEESGGSGGTGPRFRQSLSILRRGRREKLLKKTALGFRLFGGLFCLVSFSVMAADRNQGWALDSFYRYREFRYSMSVNVIGFAYSAAQALNLAYHLATGKYVIQHQLRNYFDFAIDQMLTYLLISASSAAATRIDDWQSNWGKDKFPELASVSVSMSFLAFAALASSSLISGYALCNSRSMGF